MAFELPDRGFVFWPVGTGDSTTIVVNTDTVVQVDIHEVVPNKDDEYPKMSVLSELLPLLPQAADGRPYLAAFGATHLDQDHVKGFADLLDQALIGDLWFTPRVLWEEESTENGLCDDAVAFRDEALRRIEAIKANGKVGSGDRIRIIGYHEVLHEHSDIYKDLPEGAVTVPGSRFSSIDGEDYEGDFSAFVHAPFKDDTEGERNATSFALQVALGDGDAAGSALLLGDLSYPTLTRIFATSDDEDLQWNVFLAPHHCSKSAMYWKGPDDETEKLRRDILNSIEESALDPDYIVASSAPIPDNDEAGANPPHAKAANRYREITDEFLCTSEESTVEAPEPIVFEVGSEGISRRAATGAGSAKASDLREAADRARGAAVPAATTGFGVR